MKIKTALLGICLFLGNFAIAQEPAVGAESHVDWQEVSNVCVAASQSEQTIVAFLQLIEAAKNLKQVYCSQINRNLTPVQKDELKKITEPLIKMLSISKLHINGTASFEAEQSDTTEYYSLLGELMKQALPVIQQLGNTENNASFESQKENGERKLVGELKDFLQLLTVESEESNIK